MEQQHQYRSTRIYDIHDNAYTKELVSTFKMLPLEIQSKFQLFTNNLINDNCINSYSLMDAINDFNKNNNNIYKGVQEWKNFDDRSFNYRPWQG